MVCDILFENAKVYNSAYRRFFDGYMAVRGALIVCTGRGDAPESLQAAKRINLGGRAIVPGLIDSHMHIESSSLTPMAYANEAVRHGVTTIVSEPHEIANVAGVAGIDAMMEAGRGAPIDIFYGIPSCVPSTNFSLETSGAEIDVKAVDVTFRSIKGEINVCSMGASVPFSEEKAKEILMEDEIDVLITLRDGNCAATAWGCDLTYDYVKINGDYRT